MGIPFFLLLWLQASPPPAALERFQAGLTLSAGGKHEEARRRMQEAWNLGYQNAAVLYRLVEEDRSLGDKATGLRHFQLLAEQFPESPWLHVLYADAHLAKQQETEARREFDEALRVGVPLPGVAFRAGYLDFRSGRYEQAVALFRRELEWSPSYADASLFLAESLRQLGRGAEAAPYYRKAIALDSGAELAYRALVAELMDEGDLKGAAEVLEKAEQRFPEDASFAAQMARILTKLHRDDEALVHERRYQALREKQRQKEAKP